MALSGTVAIPPPTWNTIWDDIFSRRDWGKYPKEELIRFVAWNYYSVSDRNAVRFLDLGCGYGSSAWYLAREGFSVDAIDGSAVIVEKLKQRLDAENLTACCIAGDIVELPYPPKTFDCVVDIGCLMCNSPDDTRRILDGVYKSLKPGGKLFSVSGTPKCFGHESGPRVAEATYRDLTTGPFASTGTVRFSTEAQIRDIYSRFDQLTIGLSEYSLRDPSQIVSNWLIEGTRT